MSVRPVSQAAASTRRPGSAPAYSRVRSPAIFSTARRAAASSETAIRALASVGMALSLPPPEMSASRSSVSSPAAWSTRPSAVQAFALPLSISVPEWPPARPRTVTSSAVPSKGTRLTGRTHRAMLPPAQLTVKIPSASESRLMSFRPRRGETSSASAPSMPISSSVVNTASSRGWGS